MNTPLMPKLMTIGDQYGQAELIAMVKQLLKRNCDTAHCVDQLRFGVATKTGCAIEDAERLILGIVHLTRRKVKKDKHQLFLSAPTPGENSLLMTRRSLTTKGDLGEMIYSVMCRQAQVAKKVIPQIAEWFMTMDDSLTKELKIQDISMTHAAWIGDREFYHDTFLDPETRLYLRGPLNPQRQESDGALVGFAEETTFSDADLQFVSGLGDRMYGVNLDNCEDIWKDRNSLVRQIGTRAINFALGLLVALQTGKTWLMVHQDRSSAYAQDQGMMVRCRKTLSNCNMLAGPPVDLWNLIQLYLFTKQRWLTGAVAPDFCRKLVKIPGTPMGYQASPKTASARYFGLEDDGRDLNAVDDDDWLLSGAPQWFRILAEAYLLQNNITRSNKNVLAFGLKLATLVQAGMKQYAPGSFEFGRQIRAANQKVRESTGTGVSWFTATDYNVKQLPWRKPKGVDAVDENGKLVTKEIETTVCNPQTGERYRAFVTIVPVQENTSDLAAGPCIAQSAEASANFHFGYNMEAGAPWCSTHDDEMTTVRDAPKVSSRLRNAVWWTHQRNTFAEVMTSAGLAPEYSGPPLTRDEIAGNLTG